MYSKISNSCKIRVIRYITFLLFHFCVVVFCNAQIVNEYVQLDDRVNVLLQDGTISIHPLANDVVRVRFYKGVEPIIPEFIVHGTVQTPPFQVLDLTSTIEVRLKEICVVVNKKTGYLSFRDASGKIFLSEKEGSRKMIPDSVMGEQCFLVEQAFESSEKECLFGLGQFQDGHYNVKGITRRLIQVNSQIALPFVYSSKGYGLLWHQYGLTDYNPADHPIKLLKHETSIQNEQTAEVTTTSGTQRVLQNQSLYSGNFSVPEDGEYVLFLDLGDMGNRHFVAIDEKVVIDQTNFWLPPAVSASVRLHAGEHRIQVICKSDNNPKLFWRQKDNSTVFRSPHAQMIDYIVFYGPTADSVIAGYRRLTGNVPLLPIWAYGFWQCRERYTSASHLIETVKEFRKRKIPMDVIVQDWQYWGNHGWGVPQFDETKYPDPPKFIKELHDLHVRFNISIWSNPDQNSEMGKKLMAKNYFIPGTKWLDYFNTETRKEYWNILNENMFQYGVDSWWMDAVEPENDALKGTRTFIGPGDFYRLTYPLMVSKAVYEGQRETTSEKRVCILTRCAFLGQQRYGIINWSGDIGGNWDAFKRQIVAGLNYSITGFPYWTTDVGGFFRPGQAQYTDEKYHELLIRWFQWGAFNPIFRVHGYQSETEPWKYGDTVEQNIRKILNLRYCLLPYIYSEAWQISQHGSTLMRPLVMDFRDDTIAISCAYEYMFGKSILVAPVTEPGVREWNVYLPSSTDWYDFWTGEKFNGGKFIIRKTPIEILPLYIKAGSIVPIGPQVQYTIEKKWNTLEIRIYEGADGEFTLYEDEGDNYNYEKGFFSEIQFRWDNKEKKLTISDRKGSFPGMVNDRIFRIVLVKKERGIGNTHEKNADRIVNYTGKNVIIRMK
ncbi:MAG: TIM-barrel domain-containing protein [Melioribacteraceae bacterium]